MFGAEIENKSTASGTIYARSPNLGKKLKEIIYSPVKWRDNRAKGVGVVGWCDGAG